MAQAPAIPGLYGEILQECVACGGKEIRFWRSKHFQYTEKTRHGRFDIYRCSRCGTGFLNHPPHVQWLRSIYQYSGQALTRPATLDEVLAREAESPNCTVDAARMARLASRFNASGNRLALDIGSGFGFYTRALRQLGYSTVGINPGRYENAVFRELNGDEPVPVMFEEFESAGPFGVVVMSQVLEHLLEPDKSIKKAAGLLEPGGVLACAVPNYRSFLVKLLGTKDNACLWVPEHVNYFTVDGLATLMERNGFRVADIQLITRIPCNALSKRLGINGRPAAFVDGLARLAQTPLAKLMDLLGLGIYINLYAVKQ